MDVKASAEESATQAAQRLFDKHGPRSVVIAVVITQTDLAIARAGLSKEEWQTVIQELQAGYDDYTAFVNQN